jgi:hypothetical protein
MTRETVKIGRRVYNFRFKDYIAGNCLGLCEFPHKSIRGRITVKTGQTDFNTADTILHEVLHAICDNRKLKLEDNEEERIVAALATGLTHFFRDNPEFRDKVMRLIDGDD